MEGTVPTAVTDSNGAFRLNLRAGPVWVVARSEGYHGYAAQCFPDSSESLVHTFKLVLAMTAAVDFHHTTYLDARELIGWNLKTYAPEPGYHWRRDDLLWWYVSMHDARAAGLERALGQIPGIVLR